MEFALALALFLQDGDKLFNEKDLTGWKFVSEDEKADPAKTFTIDGGVLKCSGSPAGYLRTEKAYKNFTLRFDWRYARPSDLKDDSKFGGNSGYLIWISGERALGVWPKSIEVQGMNRDAGMILPIPRGVKCKHTDDLEARKKALKPVGEWNAMEIRAKDGALDVFLNGAKVSTVTECELTEGPIGFQSEGAEIHWRNVRIKTE